MRSVFPCGPGLAAVALVSVARKWPLVMDMHSEFLKNKYQGCHRVVTAGQ